MNDKSLRVIVAGSPRWTAVLKEEISASGMVPVSPAGVRDALLRGRVGAFTAGLRARIVHQVWGRLKLNHLIWRAKRLRQRVVMHWIGTDVMQLRSFVVLHKRLPEFYGRYVDVHLADSPQLQRELSVLGVESQVIRLLPRCVDAEVMPLPAKPAVLSYWTNHRPEFYGSSMYVTLARSLPHIDFYVVGADASSVENPPANMRFLGEVKDMDAVYRQVTALFRVVEHDSLSAMVLEAMARGRHVLYCYDFPHCSKIVTMEDAIRHVEMISRRSEPDRAGAAYVREHYSWRKEMAALRGIYATLLER